MRVPSLAALAVICAACADGNPAITSPHQPSLALVRGSDVSKIARCTFRKPQLTLRAGTSDEVGIDCRDRSGRYLGEIDARTANYSSDNARIASVSQDGHISARGAGSTLIRATHARYPFQDSIRVVVTGSIVKPGPTPNPRPNPSPTPKPKPAPQPAPAPTPPPPTGPPAPTAGVPNQPPGMFLITDRQFDSKAMNNNDRGSSGSDGWSGTEYRYPRFSIVSDPSAPNGDGRVAQMLFPANMKAGTGPATSTIYLPAGIKQVYISVWAKISSNWVGNQASGNKMFFFGSAGGNSQFFFNATGAGSAPLYPHLMWQGVIGVDANHQRRRTPNVSPNQGQQLLRGVWQQWEFLFTCNSAPNVFDGTADLWINGKHITTAKDISWFQAKHPTRACDMNVFNWNPTYGGGGASPGVDQYLWFDRVYISGR